jgi:hypothetical protein
MNEYIDTEYFYVSSRAGVIVTCRLGFASTIIAQDIVFVLLFGGGGVVYMDHKVPSVL